MCIVICICFFLFSYWLVIFLWQKLSNKIPFFPVNINFACDNPELVFWFWVTRYTLKKFLDIVSGFLSVWLFKCLFDSDYKSFYLSIQSRMLWCGSLVYNRKWFTKILELYCGELHPLNRHNYIRNTKSSKEFMQKSNCTTVDRGFIFHHLWPLWETSTIIKQYCPFTEPAKLCET